MRNRITFLIVVLAGAVLGTGCPRQANPPPPPTKVPAVPTSPATGTTVPTNVVRRVGPLHPPAEGAESTQTAESLEARYLGATVLLEKIRALQVLPDMDEEAAVAALGRLFHYEQQPELQEEILVTLSDVPGQEAAKGALLREATAPAQAEGVRLAAIEALVELEEKEALPFLRGLKDDPNERVRAAVREAIEDFDEP